MMAKLKWYIRKRRFLKKILSLMFMYFCLNIHVSKLDFAILIHHFDYFQNLYLVLIFKSCVIVWIYGSCMKLFTTWVIGIPFSVLIKCFYSGHSVCHLEKSLSFLLKRPVKKRGPCLVLVKLVCKFIDVAFTVLFDFRGF